MTRVSARASSCSSSRRETKIRAKYLRALEEERFDLLPGDTYVKGFLRIYAERLGLDGQLYVDEYNSRFSLADEPVLATQGPQGPPQPLRVSRRPDRSRGHRRRDGSRDRRLAARGIRERQSHGDELGDRQHGRRTGRRNDRCRFGRRGVERGDPRGDRAVTRRGPAGVGARAGSCSKGRSRGVRASASRRGGSGSTSDGPETSG